jgi:hypothetical protein
MPGRVEKVGFVLSVLGSVVMVDVDGSRMEERAWAYRCS